MRKILVVLALAGCDPAAPFLGTWRGPESLTATVNGKTASAAAGIVTETMSENVTTGDVDMSECNMSGTPSGALLLIHPFSAPCFSPPDSDGCVAAVTVSYGAASVRGNLMTFSLNGGVTVNCPGRAIIAGTYASSADMTRQ